MRADEARKLVIEAVGLKKGCYAYGLYNQVSAENILKGTYELIAMESGMLNRRIHLCLDSQHYLPKVESTLRNNGFKTTAFLEDGGFGAMIEIEW